jgi:excisionase family DNA binding protein
VTDTPTSWMTVRQVAEELLVDEETVRRWIKHNELPALELGSRKMGYRIKRSDLDDFVEERYRGKIAA